METDDLQIELMQLNGKRYHCSQILMILGLRLQGKDPEDSVDLIRASGGLTVGLGRSNETCGALLGGACLLGLYGGKGHDGEEEAEWLRLATRRLVEWFHEACAVRDGNGVPSVRCTDILSVCGLARCGGLVREVYIKVMELLEHFRVDPLSGREG